MGGSGISQAESSKPDPAWAGHWEDDRSELDMDCHKGHGKGGTSSVAGRLSNAPVGLEGKESHSSQWVRARRLVLALGGSAVQCSG